MINTLRSPRGLLGLTVLAVASFGVSAQAQTVLTAVADSWIENINPNTNYGTENRLRFNRQAAGTAPNFTEGTRFRKTYIAFDATSFDFSGAAIESVSLQFVVSANFTPTTAGLTSFKVFGLIDGSAGDAVNGWTETGITWNNAPSNDSGANTMGAGAVELFTYTLPAGAFSGSGGLVPAGTVISLNSSTLTETQYAALLGFVQADTNNRLSFVLTGQSLDFSSLEIASRSNTTYAGPQLTLTAIPEPSAFAAMAGLGALSCVALRRRRAGV